MMNSQQETITRLRYFNYKNSQITDILSAITRSSYTYLDISKTQYKGFNGDNDLMKIYSNKFIKIYSYCESNSIIITIIQFYDNESCMSIKIYNMLNDNGFRYMCQGRIVMLKNSFFFLFIFYKKWRSSTRIFHNKLSKFNRYKFRHK